MYRVAPHIRHFATALLSGATLASLWVNLSADSYYDVMETRIWQPALPAWTGAPDPILSLQSVVSEGLMALFIATLAKELWEALVLEKGALAGATRRSMPLGAVIGGVLGAILVWVMTLPADPDLGDLSRSAGWPLPIGSDVALSYLFGVRIFGKSHPALHLLMLIAIAFDILGLLALGFGFPVSGLRPAWLGLPLLSFLFLYWWSSHLARPEASERQHRRAASLWPYALAGLVSWIGTILSGLPGSLGLLPIVFVIPHAERSFGLFAEAEAFLHDPLNRLAHHLVWPVAGTLFLFGLTHGGVDVSALSAMTWRVVAALWIGKPIGLLCGAVAMLALGGWRLPRGVHLSDLVLIAVLAGIGGTVPLLALDSALPGGLPAEGARAGVALSLLFGPLALLLGLAIRPKTPENVS